jgi:hypothetical protein
MRTLRLKGLLQRAGIIGASLAAAALLTGCTAVRFGYNQGAELGYWWLDRYFDFSDGQTPVVREGLNDWFTWHRRTQLPDYAARLAELRVEARADTQPDRMCLWFERVGERGDAAIERALPWLAQAARDSTPAQIAHLRKQQAKRTAEFKDEYQQADPQERLKASVERAVERFERLYGRLGEAQKAVIARETQASPFDVALWSTERERRNQDLLTVLRELQAHRPDAAETQRRLKALVERNRTSTDPAYREYQARLTRYNCEFAAKVHNVTTPAQREAAATRLKGWEDDFRALARQATPAGSPAPAVGQSVGSESPASTPRTRPSSAGA